MSQELRIFADTAHVVASLARALFYRLAEHHDQLALGLVHLLVQLRALNGTGDVAAEHVHQLGLRQVQQLRAAQIQPEGLATAARKRRVKLLPLDDPLSACCLLLQVPYLREVACRIERLPEGESEIAGGCEHIGCIVARQVFEHQRMGDLLRRAEQSGRQTNHTLGKLRRHLALEHPRGRTHQLLQALAAVFEQLDIPVKTQAGVQQRKEFLRGQLGLVTVVIDVVAGDYLALGRLPRLAGAQHDPHHAVAQLVADVLHRIETGSVCFHHHVHQHHRDVGLAGHDLDGLAASVGIDEYQDAAVVHETAQRQAGDTMHLVFVVDDQQLPGGKLQTGLFWLLRNETKLVVAQRIVGHLCHFHSLTSMFGHAGVWVFVVIGSVRSKQSPAPGRLLAQICPLKVWWTRLNTMCRPRPLPPSPRRVV